GFITTLYSFTNGADGGHPYAGLVQGKDFNFYGTTYKAGKPGFGTIFRVTTNGLLTTLLSFNSTNGSFPYAGLLLGSNGNFYGTTQYGGEDDHGTIFRLSFDGPPQITTQPASQFVFAGARVSLSIAVSGRQPFYYQWRKDGTNLVDQPNRSGALMRTLTLSNVSSADIGTYSVVVSNALSYLTSAGAVLEVTSSPPYLVQQPTNQTLSPGATAIF